MIVRLVVTRRSAAFEYVHQLIATEHGSDDDQRYKAYPAKGQGIVNPDMFMSKTPVTKASKWRLQSVPLAPVPEWCAMAMQKVTLPSRRLPELVVRRVVSLSAAMSQK